MSIRRHLITGTLAICLLTAADKVYPETASPDAMDGSDCYQDLILKGSWETTDGTQPIQIKQTDSHLSIVNTGCFLPSSWKRNEKISYGVALDLKYYSGISYEYIRKNISGKTISVDVFIPKGSISQDDTRPSRLRVCLKSEKNGEWAEYYGDDGLISVKDEGMYKITLKVPDRAVATRSGKIFSPEN
ncbi:MAG: hypothetical protein WC779_08080, partial [Candidatus Omnitrophota bacterium]